MTKKTMLCSPMKLIKGTRGIGNESRMPEMPNSERGMMRSTFQKEPVQWFVFISYSA